MLKAARQGYPDAVALIEDYYERGWTDGLPLDRKYGVHEGDEE